MGISSLADCERRNITCRNVIPNENLQRFLWLRLSSTHRLAHRAASQTHLVLSHTLVAVVGRANESARDSLDFQSCHFRRITTVSPGVWEYQYLCLVFLSHYGGHQSQTSVRGKNEWKSEAKRCKERGERESGGGECRDEAYAHLRHLSSAQLLK